MCFVQLRRKKAIKQKRPTVNKGYSFLICQSEDTNGIVSGDPVRPIKPFANIGFRPTMFDTGCILLSLHSKINVLMINVLFVCIQENKPVLSNETKAHEFSGPR